MSEFSFVVEEFNDTVKRRAEKVIAKETKFRESWKRQPLLVFETKSEAIQFMVQRAEARVAKAKKELENETRRLKRCRGIQRESENNVTTISD